MLAAESRAVTKVRHGKPGNPNWTKGVSGNPGGKRQIPLTVQELARAKTANAISVLTRAMEKDDCPWPTRVRAAEILLERGHGRAPIMVDPEAANQVGASFAALLDAIANQSQVDQPPMINVTPEPVDG